MNDWLEGLPALDAHAHIATDVTPRQVDSLGLSHTFAVTRSLREAEQAPTGFARWVTWGIGVHPGVPAAQGEYDERTFASLLPRFAFVGEIGLDRRAGNLDRQTQTLTSILRVAADHPVLLSLHSSGAASELMDLLGEHPHPGAILHWWTDEGPAFDLAIASGAYFSVNAATKATIIGRLPLDRVLTETDFPARRAGGLKPGDTRKVESLLSEAWRLDERVVRHHVWANLRRLATRADALDRLPAAVADIIDSV